MEEQNIILKAQELYFRHGVRRITMDDISSAAGISKKTLYTHFENKDALVKRCVMNHISEQKTFIEAIHKHKGNAIDEILQIYEFTVNKLQAINPAFILDIRKYHQNSWQVFQEFKSTFINNNVKANLEKGIREGLYRADLDLNIIASIYTARLDLMINPDVFSPRHYSYSEIFMELFIYHVRGISSKKGIAYLENHIKIEL